MIQVLIRAGVTLAMIFISGFLLATLWNGCIMPLIPSVKGMSVVQGAAIIALIDLLSDIRMFYNSLFISEE